MDTSIIPADFTDAAGISVILGFFVPLVMNFVNKATWPNWLKALLTFIAAAIVGGVTAWTTGAYEGLGIPSAIILTFVVAIAAYQMGWKNWFPNMQRGSAEATAAKPLTLTKDASGTFYLDGQPVDASTLLRSDLDGGTGTTTTTSS